MVRASRSTRRGSSGSSQLRCKQWGPSSGRVLLRHRSRIRPGRTRNRRDAALIGVRRMALWWMLRRSLCWPYLMLRICRRVTSDRGGGPKIRRALMKRAASWHWVQMRCSAWVERGKSRMITGWSCAFVWRRDWGRLVGVGHVPGRRRHWKVGRSGRSWTGHRSRQRIRNRAGNRWVYWWRPWHCCRVWDWRIEAWRRHPAKRRVYVDIYMWLGSYEYLCVEVVVVVILYMAGEVYMCIYMYVW